jgi:transcriptional regulator with XRE-family HTH domain
MESYQDKLNLILQETKWSRDKLADLLQVSNMTFSKWINGKSMPADDHAKRINRLYEKLTTDLAEKLEYTRREYIESLEKSFHRHEIYELDKNN